MFWHGNIFSKGLFLLYIKHLANLFTCRLGCQYVKFIKKIKFTCLLFRLHESINKNLNSRKVTTLFRKLRNVHYILHFRFCADLIEMWMRQLISYCMVVNYTLFPLIHAKLQISTTHFHIQIKISVCLQ